MHAFKKAFMYNLFFDANGKMQKLKVKQISVVCKRDGSSKQSS